MTPPRLTSTALAVLLALAATCGATTFRFEAPDATSVDVAGEFNNWTPEPLQRDGDGPWTVTLDLPPGHYAYKFLVNGETWTLDPANPARKFVDEIENSSVVVGEDGGTVPAEATASPVATPAATPAVSDAAGRAWTFTFSAPAAQEVFVAGSFNGWNTTSHPLTNGGDGVWATTVDLPTGETTYKFIVDGEWRTDPTSDQTVPDGEGGNNSLIIIGDGTPDSGPAAAPSEPPPPTPKPAAKRTVPFSGASLTEGEAAEFELTITDRPTLQALEKAYGKPSSKIKALVAVPAGFDPAKSYPLVIATETTDGDASSVRGARLYLDSVLAKGGILMAVDGEFGRPTDEGAGDRTSFRWALNRALLAAMHEEWPASRKWPIITAGLSGGAGYASYNAIMLVDQGQPVIGIFLANSGWDPADFAAELKRAPTATMRSVPVFITAGEADTLATKEITERSRDDLERERFRKVRYETFPGGHELSPALFQAAIDWFLAEAER